MAHLVHPAVSSSKRFCIMLLFVFVAVHRSPNLHTHSLTYLLTYSEIQITHRIQTSNQRNTWILPYIFCLNESYSGIRSSWTYIHLLPTCQLCWAKQILFFFRLCVCRWCSWGERGGTPFPQIYCGEAPFPQMI